MPNPFPGMDPYLEGPSWSVVHSNLIQEISRQLSLKLRPKYVAWSNERIVLSIPDPIELPTQQSRIPDVGVFNFDDDGMLADSGVAATASIVVDAVMPEPLVQTFVEVREIETQSLVTAIEMLSPTNKRGDGLVEFRQKRIEYLSGNAHYIEIDLLRIGERFPTSRPLPSVPYCAFVSRTIRRPHVEAWPIAMDQALPTIPVPLLKNDPEVMLDLQQAWQTIYEIFSYDRLVDHARDPVVPLSQGQSAWARKRLVDSGILP